MIEITEEQYNILQKTLTRQEKKREYDRNYVKTHKDKHNERVRRYYSKLEKTHICECCNSGFKLKCDLKKHFLSKKHIRNNLIKQALNKKTELL